MGRDGHEAKARSLASVRPPLTVPALADLGGWLASITPVGAAALAIYPVAAPFAFGSFPLPLTSPGEPAFEWLNERLRAIRILDARGTFRPLHDEAVARLAGLLGGPERVDGLPGWHPKAARRRHHRHGVWPWERGEATPYDHADADATSVSHTTGATTVTVRVVRSTAPPKRHDRGKARDLYAAVYGDLTPLRVVDVSRVLGFTDHESLKNPRKATAAIQHGRELWHALGAWPWAHTPDGRLPRDWRTSPTFTEPLRAWLASPEARLAAQPTTQR